MDLEPAADGKILGGRIGQVGMLVINNPDRRNAISLDMWQAATEIVDRLAADDAARLLIVSGSGGKAFASGADIAKFESERATAADVDRYQAISARLYERIDTFPKPTIAKINGYCIGGGLALALCCDLRICAEGARFGIPAAKLGLGYGLAAFARLANVVGTAMAAEILFTGRQFSDKEAYDMGLVNRVVPVGELDAYVDDYASTIAGNAPLTIALAKACKIAVNAGKFAESGDRLDAMVKACFASADYREGRQAFLEKRKPRFEGR